MSAGNPADFLSNAQRQLRDTGEVDLISPCAHALRTPLNAILGFAQILLLDRSQPLSSVQKQRVDQIQAAGWQLLRMIDDAVELTRIGAGRLSVSMEPVALGAALHDGLSRLDTQTADRVRLETSPNLDAAVRGDPELLAQIVANLVVGVLQCNRRDSPVRVGVHAPVDGGSTVWIRGAAPLLALDQLEKTFLPLDHLARDHAGTSLQISLALTQKLVELVGGRLQLHQDPDSEFEVSLALRAADFGAAAAPLNDLDAT